VYNRWPKCGHPCCSKSSDEENHGDPDHEPAGADSDPEAAGAEAEPDPDLEEWVVSTAAQGTAAESREQKTKEHHE